MKGGGGIPAQTARERACDMVTHLSTWADWCDRDLAIGDLGALGESYREVRRSVLCLGQRLRDIEHEEAA